MIVFLTCKQPSELENTFNGEFNWLPEIQKTGNDNINHKLINLLNDMVQQDVKLRPANAGVLHRRLSKIVKQVPVNKD